MLGMLYAGEQRYSIVLTHTAHMVTTELVTLGLHLLISLIYSRDK